MPNASPDWAVFSPGVTKGREDDRPWCRPHDPSYLGLFLGIPCITLYQPWATAVVIRAKRFETRSWSAPPKLLGRRIAIHAGRKLDLDWSPELEGALAPYGVLRDYPFPLGAFLATAVLTKVIPVEDVEVTAAERACGIYTAGRYAWQLDDIYPLPEAI